MPENKRYRFWWERPISAVTRRSQFLKDLHERIKEGLGASSHSETGHTLLMTLERLEEDKIPYVLKALPGYGYTVERWEEGVQQKEKLDGIW